jgi:FkbM family methyltransferase
MNFSGISDRSLVGKALRLPLRLLPAGAVVPVLQGELRGKRWVVGASNHGCWLGSYEHDKQQAFRRAVRPGGVVFDLGAHVGYYTLLASSLVGPEGRVFAFEPMPRNLGYLKRHLRLNRAGNVTVIEAAVSDAAGWASFDEEIGCAMARLSANGKLRVRVVTLDALVSGGELPPPDFLKIDIEGAEAMALGGARETLIAHRPTIFLATHGREVHEECCRFLEGVGYRLQTLDGKRLEESDELLAVARGSGDRH